MPQVWDEFLGRGFGGAGMRRDLPVFCAAAWWRDCDPFASVVALSAKDCERRIEEAMVEEAERMTDSEALEDETDDEARDRLLGDIVWSGVHRESLRRVLRDSSDRGMVVGDLQTQGWAFLEVG